MDAIVLVLFQFHKGTIKPVGALWCLFVATISIP